MKMISMSNKTYDILKNIALIILPVAELIGKIASIWGFPGDKIVATMIAINAFLGAILTISSKNYHESEEVEE